MGAVRDTHALERRVNAASSGGSGGLEVAQGNRDDLLALATISDSVQPSHP